MRGTRDCSGNGRDQRGVALGRPGGRAGPRHRGAGCRTRNGVERQRGAQAVDVQSTAEAAGADLERVRSAIRRRASDFAVEHQRADRQRARHLHQLGDRAGDVVQAAREHATSSSPSGESARARRQASTRLPPARCARARRPTLSADCASIGSTGRPTSQPKRAQTGRPVAQACLGDSAQVAAQHDRAAHVGERHVERPRQRLVHDAFERALAQLADRSAARENAARRWWRARRARGAGVAARSGSRLPATRPICSSAASTSISVSVASVEAVGRSRMEA